MTRHSEKKKQPDPTNFSDHHSILANAPIGVFTSIPEGRYISVNPALARMYGYDSPEELIESVTDIAEQVYVDPSDREDFIRLMKEQGEVVNHECRLRRKDGSIIWTSRNVREIRDSSGKNIYYQGFVTDITKSKQTRQELNETRWELSTILDSVPAMIWRKDQDSKYVHANRMFCDVVGRELKDIKGKSDFDVHPQEIAMKYVSDDKLVLSSGRPVRNISELHKKSTGQTGWSLTEKLPCYDKDGNIVGTIGFALDITDRKQAEDALRKSEEKHRRLFETMAQGVIYQAADGTIISANPAAERILGLTLDQMRGKTSKDPRWKMIKEDGTEVSGSKHPAMIALRTGKTIGPVTRGVFHPDKDTYVWLSITAIPLFQPGESKPFQAYATFEDITKRKQAVERLKEREAFIKATLDNLPVGVAINSVDPKVHFTYMNDNFARFYRTTREELAPPNDFWEVVYQDPEFREIIKKRVVEDCAGNDPDLMYWKDVPVFRPGQEPFYITAKNIPVPGSNLMVSTVWDVTDRKLTEDRLRESEARFRSIYENAAVGLARVSLDFRIMNANKAYCSMLGYQENDLIGRHLREITHPDSLEQDIDKQSKLASGEIDHYRVEKKFIHKNGQTIYAILDANTIRDVSGENLYFLGSVLDITERKQAEEDLKKIEWMLSKKLYSDMSRQEKLHDQGYGDLTRLNRDGIILKYVGKEFLGNIAKDYLDLLETSSAVYEQNGDYAFGIFASGWCRMMDRASRDLCDTPDNVQALNSGRWLCHESCWTDCSKEAIARGAPVDIECSGGIRLYAEPIFAGGEVIGVINFGYGDPPREHQKLRQLAKTYSLSYDALEKESYAHDSRPPYIIELAKNRLRASARLIGSLVEVRMAQEEREKLQAQLLQAQKMESVGILAGGIAHDFNNLLHVMGGNLEFLDMKLAEDHPGKKRIPTIQKSMNRAAQLVRQMLQFSRKAEAKRQDMDLNHQVKEAAEMLERTIPKMISIELNLDKEARFINADPIQVEQILLNLGKNSADAMPDGGRLIIETKNTIMDQDFVRTHQGARPGEYVLMTVTDTGCGMDKKTLEHIFDPFFTTKDVGKGTGLGLASAYGIVKAHEGYITCQSRPGKGTTFNIYWPAVNT